MLGLGTQELVIVMIIVVILFGATRLPQIGKGMGEAIRNFKRGIDSKEIETNAKKPSEGDEEERAG